LTAKAGRNCGEAHGFHGPPLSLFPRPSPISLPYLSATSLVSRRLWRHTYISGGVTQPSRTPAGPARRRQRWSNASNVQRRDAADRCLGKHLEYREHGQSIHARAGEVGRANLRGQSPLETSLPDSTTAGTKRAHSLGCGEFHRVTETPRRQGFHANSEAGCNHFPPTGHERMSDDAKFILGIG
jgi:hypothetical protein